MSAALAPYFGRVSLRRLLLPLTFLSTTTFAATYAAVRRPGTGEHPLGYFWGLCAVSVPGAVLGTLAGYRVAGLMSAGARATVEMVLPIYFMTLLAREWPKARPLLAGALGFVLTPLLERMVPDLGLLLASLGAGAALALWRERGDDQG
jgi:predicted branched-subunit amino acid permease